MGKRKKSVSDAGSGRDQNNLREFLFKMFEDHSAPEEALANLRSRYDLADFARVRAGEAKLASPFFVDARGPRTRN